MLNNKAQRKLSTLKESPKIQLANKMMQALITIRNNPKVKMVAGKVNRTKRGLTNIFKSAKTKATASAPRNPLTSIPGKI